MFVYKKEQGDFKFCLYPREGQYEKGHVFITYFARADNMLLPRKQITCHSVISIKYVIISKYLLYYIIYLSFLTNYVCHIREFSNTIPLLHYSSNSKYIHTWNTSMKIQIQR
jgi:hypothetical protein